MTQRLLRTAKESKNVTGKQCSYGLSHILNIFRVKFQFYIKYILLICLKIYSSGSLSFETAHLRDLFLGW